MTEMGWIALAIFFGCLMLGNAIVHAADRLAQAKISIVFPKVEYKIETSRDGYEQTGHIHTRIH